jgi:hypothetical protein
VSESSESSDEEDVVPRKQSFVPALNLTDVKKKGSPDAETGGGKEKKGLLGTVLLSSPLPFSSTLPDGRPGWSMWCAQQVHFS